MKMVAATKVEVGGTDAGTMMLPTLVCQSARVPECQRAHSLPATCCSPDKNSASCITSNVCDECRHF